MKKVIHKSIAVFMAFVVLMTTMSFTIDMHYCGDTLVDTSIFHKAKKCGMEKTQATSNKGCFVAKKNCCSDEQLVIDGQSELQQTFEKLTLEQQVFLASFVYTYTNLFEAIDTTSASYRDYEPPRVIRQIYKLDETYLI